MSLGATRYGSRYWKENVPSLVEAVFLVVLLSQYFVFKARQLPLTTRLFYGAFFMKYSS